MLLNELVAPEQFRKYAEYLLACARFSTEQRVQLDRVLKESRMQIETLFTDYEKRGRAEGRLQEARDTLVRLLSLREIKVSAAQRKRVGACGDLEMLHRWLDAAATARTAREVFAAAKQ